MFASSFVSHTPPSYASLPLSISRRLPTVSVTSFHARRPKVALGRRGRPVSFVVKAAQSGNYDDAAIGELLTEAQIFTAAGVPVLFKDLWDQEEGVAVVALLRHFGCPCCWELASSLKELKPRFDASRVKLIAVGVGTLTKLAYSLKGSPFHRIAYMQTQNARFVLRSGADFFNPASAKVFSRFDALQKATKNYTMSATPDDRSSVLQQGGMFVFKGKNLLYAWKDEGTGDHAPLDEILNLCCAAPIA